LACRGSAGKNTSKSYLPENCKLEITISDEVLLEECILIVLEPDSIDSTRLQTPQKCEAFNSAYLIPDRNAQDSDFLPELHRPHPQHNP
jgi:hypothetical protein